MESNTFLYGSAVTKADKSRYTKFSNSKSNNGQNISAIPQFIRKNVTIIPISKTPNSSSTTTTGQQEKTKSLLCQSEQSFSSSNFVISKEITITPYNNNENNLVSMLKKLPNITFSCINPQPVFKVPVTPIFNKEIPPKIIAPKSKVFFEKNITPTTKIKCISGKNMTKIKTKVISEKKLLPEIRKFNNIVNPAVLIDNTNNFRKTNSNSKKTPIKKQIKLHSNIPLTKNNFKKTITNHSEEIPQKYQEKENNIQRTSSPNEIFKKSTNASNTISKTVKPTKVISNYSTIFHKIKTIPEKDSIINNMKVKTNKSINGDYTLMDISTEGQINIVPAYCPLDSTSFCVPGYDSFMMGISKSSNHNIMHSETYQNDVEKKILNGHMLSELGDSKTQTSTELLHFEKIKNNGIPSLNTNKIESTTDIDSGLYSNEENITFDCIKNQHIDVNRKIISSEDEINKLENEQISNPYFDNDFLIQPSLQNNETNYTTPIVLNDNQLLQTMESYFYDNLVEKTAEN